MYIARILFTFKGKLLRNRIVNNEVIEAYFLRVYLQNLSLPCSGGVNFFQYILLNRGMQCENFCRIIFSRFGVSGRQIVGGKKLELLA